MHQCLLLIAVPAQFHEMLKTVIPEYRNGTFGLISRGIYRPRGLRYHIPASVPTRNRQLSILYDTIHEQCEQHIYIVQPKSNVKFDRISNAYIPTKTASYLGKRQ